jgi:hypothetical protein
VGREEGQEEPTTGPIFEECQIGVLPWKAMEGDEEKTFSKNIHRSSGKDKTIHGWGSNKE